MLSCRKAIFGTVQRNISMRSLFFLLLFLIQYPVLCQQPYYTKPFRGNLSQTVSYGSFRNNEFSTGIGISTPGLAGIPVIAVADGYVSYISVSNKGLGKSISITHDNGSTSVYGHLERFSKDIEEYARIIQYKNQSYEIDIDVKANLLPVQKNNIIGLSGISGETTMPMLHFALFNTKSGDFLNPLSVGVYLEKSEAPVINSIRIISFQNSDDAIQENMSTMVPVVLNNDKYTTQNNIEISATGLIGIALETKDPINTGAVAQLELSVNGVLWSELKLNRIQKTDLNSMKGLTFQDDENRLFYRTWGTDCNPLPEFRFTGNSGLLNIKPGENTDVKLSIKNASGKSSTLEFRIKGEKSNDNQIITPTGDIFKCGVANTFKVPGFEILLKENSLFEDFYPEYFSEEKTNEFCSVIHIIKNTNVPLFNPVTIRIKTDGIDKKLASKTYIILKESDKPTMLGGTWKDGWIEAETTRFGTFAAQTDTVPPVIEAISIENHEALKESNRVQFKITDTFSGIGKITGMLDGQWALFEYDAKRNLLTHYFDQTRFSFNRRHKLNLEVWDKCGNTVVYEATFEK